MRAVPLTTAKGGISRLRIRGGARADNLYDLLNGFVTEAGTIEPREGTIRNATLPATTRGLCAFDGVLHTFSHQVETMPGGYALHVLSHPTVPTATLAKVHFAEPYLGALYVVAEFSDGGVFHFWLAVTGDWEANRIYKAGDVVRATVDTGLLYRATRAGAANPSWAPNVPRALGDVVEPTVYNDFFYTVVDVQGANPASGASEPLWPESDGAQVVEDTDGILGTPATVTAPPIASVPSNVDDRYGNNPRFSNP